MDDSFEHHCRDLTETRALYYTTDAVSKWLEISGQTKWSRFLIDKLKVNGKDLLSFRKEDLTVALSSGYELEELDDLMDCIRSFRIQQLCEPDAMVSHYLTAMSVRTNSRQFRRKNYWGNAVISVNPKVQSFSEWIHAGIVCTNALKLLSSNGNVMADLAAIKFEEKNGSNLASSCSLDCSMHYKPKSEKDRASHLGDENENLNGGRCSVPTKAREEENLHANNIIDVYPKQFSLMNEIEKDSDGRFIAKISQWETPNSFYITTPQWDGEIKEMEKCLAECFRELPKIQLSDIFLGKPCCILCETSRRWMRGRICKTVPDRGKLQVHCVDHGYTVECPFRYIRELPVKMISRPPLSLRCKVELGGRYGGSDEHCLDKVSKSGFVVAVQIVIRDYDRCTVKLFNPKTMEQISA
ncbi:tudor domain protein [Trichuris suis]|nr:tudor domain protein [Trichuris suis]